MKVTYEFDSEVEGAMDDLSTFQQAEKMHSVLWDMSQYLRSQDRYVELEKQDSIERVREYFLDLLSEEGINLY